MAAPVYTEKGITPKSLSDLLDLLSGAVLDLQSVCQASEPISKGGYSVGYGVSKSKKAIAADRVTSIVREIKAVKGW